MTTTPLEMTVDRRSATNKRLRFTGWGSGLNFVEVSNNQTGPVTGIVSGLAASVSIDDLQFQVLARNIGTLSSLQLIVAGATVTSLEFR